MKIRFVEKYKLLKKAVALVVILAFFNNFILSDAWAALEEQEAPYQMSLEPESPYARLDVETFTIPGHLGEVRYMSKGASKRFIVHIQDAHCNVFAQRKVADLIDYLNKEHGITAVNLEGGSGEYDLDVFTTISGKAIRREVADYFVKKGEINGAEYYAINNPGKVLLWGIEDKDLYLKNLQVYRDSLTYKQTVQEYLKQITHILNNLKRHIYPSELLKVDMAYSAFKAGNMDFRAYLEFLIERSEGLEIPVERFENLYLLHKAMELEEKVDFSRANADRAELILQLKQRLSRNEVRQLLTRTVDFKTKKISRKAFYGYLLTKAGGLGLDLGEYKALSDYIDYVSTYETADRSRVMEEMDELEAGIKDRLYRNDTERRLNLLSRNLALMKNIFAISLTKTDYKYYLGNTSSFDIAHYLRFIDEQAPRYGISARLSEGIAALDGYRRRITGFYAYSFERDRVFLENLRFSDTSGGIKGAILMTGGFHTENLCDLLRKNQISYISILPKFTIEKDYECPYFDILAGETTNLRQMLRSVIAQASMLQIASMLSPVLARAVWGDAAIYAFRSAVIIQERIARGRRMALVKTDGSACTGDDGMPLVFGEGEAETEKISLSDLLSQAGYRGAINEDVFKVAGPPAEDRTAEDARTEPLAITEEMVRGMIFEYLDRNAGLDAAEDAAGRATLLDIFTDLARISSSSGRALAVQGGALSLLKGVIGAEDFPWDRIRDVEVFPQDATGRSLFRVRLDEPHTYETSMNNETGQPENAVFVLPSEIRFSVGRDTEGQETIFFNNPDYALKKKIDGPDAAVRHIRRDGEGNIRVNCAYRLFESNLSKRATPLAAGEDWMKDNLEKGRQLPPGFRGLGPAVRAWQSALMAMLPATFIAAGSALAIMAGFNPSMMFLLHTVLSFQALIMAFQTLQAFRVQRKLNTDKAASANETFVEIRDKFGPFLGHIVDFHESVHNWNRRRGIKEGSLADEIIAYGASYIASPVLALVYAWNGMNYRLFPDGVDTQLLSYKPDIYAESDNRRMIKNPRWKELFPKRNIRMKKPRARAIKLGGKTMVIPDTIMGGKARGANTFRLESLLGKGGFGAAFRAKVTEGRLKERDIAIKILKPGSSPSAVINFLQEYLMMKRLEDVPGVIRPYEAGYYEHNGERYYFIAMQYADGGDLGTMIQTRQAEKRVGVRDELFAEEEVYDIAGQLLSSIRAIHKKGIIHADLKPENIFYVNGRLRIADFGISRFTPQGVLSTETLTGTPEYMPNNVLRNFFVHGQDVKYNAKTDLYAIGVILYQMLHDGKLPQHRTDEEEENMNQLFENQKYAEWVDKKERRSTSETIRLLGKSRAHSRESSELEKFIAMLLLENEDGINEAGTAVSRITSSTKKIRTQKSLRGRSPPADSATSGAVKVASTIDLGPESVSTGAETVDLTSQNVAREAADFFGEPPAVNPPRGLGDIVGSETTELPSNSLLANALRRDAPWLNTIVRVLSVFSTPFHELGHITAAKLSGAFVDWDLLGVFYTGQVRTGRAPPVFVRFGGLLGNIAASSIAGIILSYSSMGPFALSSILLGYVLVINMASIFAESLGFFLGRGDLALPGPFNFDQWIDLNLQQDLASKFRVDLREVLETNPQFIARAVQKEGGFDRFYRKHFDSDFFSDFRVAANEGRDTKKLILDYLRTIASVIEGELDERLDAREILKFRKYFYRIYGNYRSENFNAQQIIPSKVIVDLDPSFLARIWAHLNGYMIIRDAFRGVPEDGEDRIFIVGRYNGRDMVFYKSISHGTWRRVEMLNSSASGITKNISKPVAESSLQLNEAAADTIDSLTRRGRPLAPENLEDIGNEWESLEKKLSGYDVPLLDRNTSGAARYAVFNSVGRDPGTGEPDRGLSEAWFSNNLSRLKDAGSVAALAERFIGWLGRRYRPVFASGLFLLVLYTACQRAVIKEVTRRLPAKPTSGAPAEKPQRTVDILIAGEERTIPLPEEAGSREVLPGYQNMISPMGTHLVFGLEKTGEDIRRLEEVRRISLDKIDKRIADLEKSGEDERMLRVLRLVREDLASRLMTDVELIAAVTTRGAELGAYIDEEGVIHVPVGQLADANLLAYSLEHEASHPYVREVYGTSGKPDEEENIVLAIGVAVFGPMIDVTVTDNGDGTYSLNAVSVDPSLRGDDPKVVEATKSKLLSMLEDIQKKRQLGETVSEELERFIIAQLEKLGVKLEYVSETGVVFAESLEIKHTEPYYASVSVRDGEKVAIANSQQAVDFAREKMPVVQVIPVYLNGAPLLVKGEQVQALVEEGIDIDGALLGDLIREVLVSLEGTGEIENLPQTLVIGFLDHSPYMFEDHVRNGFIGVNRIVERIADRRARMAVVRMGIAHEISHELTGRTGIEFEAEQLVRDAEYLHRIASEEKLSGSQEGQIKGFLGQYMQSPGFMHASYFQVIADEADEMGVDISGTERDTDRMYTRLAEAQISSMLKNNIISEYGLQELARFYRETPEARFFPGTSEYQTRLKIRENAPYYQRIKNRALRREVILGLVDRINQVKQSFDISKGESAFAGPGQGNYGHRIIGGKSEGRSLVAKREIIHAKWGQPIQELYEKVRDNVRKASKDLADSGYDLGSGMAKGLLIRAVFDAIRDNVDYDEKQTDKYAKFHYILDINRVLSDKRGVCRHMGILVGMMLEKLIQDNMIEGMVFYVRPTGRGHGFAAYVTSSGDPIILDVAQSPKADPYRGREGLKTFGYLDDFRKVARGEADLKMVPKNEREKMQWARWYDRYAHGVYDIVQENQRVADMIEQRKNEVERRRNALGLGLGEGTVLARTIMPGRGDISEALRQAQERADKRVPSGRFGELAAVEPPTPEDINAAVAAVRERAETPQEAPPEASPGEVAPGVRERPATPDRDAEQRVIFDDVFEPLLLQIAVQFNLNLISRQNWEDYKAMLRSPGARTVSRIMDSIGERVIASDADYKDLFFMDQRTGFGMLYPMVDGLFDEGRIKSARARPRRAQLGSAVTGWLRRITPDMPRLARSLLAAPVAEEALYRGLPLLVTAALSYILTSGLDWLLIMHGMIIPQVFMAGKFVLDHTRGTRSPPEVFRVLLVPSLVAVANAVILPFLSAGPVAFMGLSILNHSIANLAVVGLNRFLPTLKLGEAVVSPDTLWEGLDEFVSGIEGIDDPEDMKDVLIDILAVKLDRIRKDVSDLKGIDFDLFVVENVSFVGRGDFNSVFRVQARTDAGTYTFSLRLLTPRDIKDLERIKALTNEEVAFFLANRTGEKTLRTQSAYFINEQLDAFISRILKSSDIYGFTVGDYVDGVDLDKVPDEEKRPMYRKAVKSLVDLWLSSFDMTTGTGWTMYDLKGSNFVKQPETEDVYIVDAGALMELDFTDFKSLVDLWLNETFGVEPGTDEAEYFTGAIDEAVKEFLKRNRKSMIPAKLAMLEVVTGIETPAAEPVRAPVKLTLEETRDILSADLRELGSAGAEMLTDIIADKIISGSKMIGEQQIGVPSHGGTVRQIAIPESIQGVTGEYRLKEALGAGGFGAVMKGETPDGSEVAVKVLLPGAAPQVVLKFFNEYLTMRHLEDHDSVIDAYELGTYKLNGQRYYYMIQEYAEGGSLWDIMNLKKRIGDRFRDEEVRSVAEELLEAIGELHERGILHCDIKPNNILLSEGKLKITDFGLSVYAPEGEVEFGMGRFIGTPGYISSESMIEGVVKPKTDLFALGHILYELMNEGKNPYTMSDQTYQEILAESKRGVSPAMVRWVQDRDLVIRRIQRQAKTPLEKLVAALLTENIFIQQGWTDALDRGGADTVKEAKLILAGVDSAEELEDIAPKPLPPGLDDILPAEGMGDRVSPQIGKLANVVGIKESGGKKFMVVETTEGRKKKIVRKEVEITRSTGRDTGDIDSLKEFLSLARDNLPPDKENYASYINAIIDFIDRSDSGRLPEFYTYRAEDLVADVFGWASSSPDENMIIVNESVAQYDLAWLHELGEYLIQPREDGEAPVLKPVFDGGRLTLYLDGEAVGEPMMLEGEPLAQAMKDPANPHYLLRAFQREVFPFMDRALTEKIKTEQIASILKERVPSEAWEAQDMDPELAARGLRDFIRYRRDSTGADDRIVICYRVGTGQERSFMLRQGEGDLIRLDMEDVADLYRGRYVGAEMNVLITGADPDTQTPEEMERYMDLAMMAKDYLEGLTRNKLVDELRKISGNENLDFGDIGKDVYITDHLEGSNKHVFRIEFSSPDKARTYTMAVATKTEKLVGDIAFTEIRELDQLQEGREQVVPRFGATRTWNGKKWFTEEFIEGKTATQLAREGKLTLNMRKKIVEVLLSIAVGLNGYVPLDIHGGNFVVRDNGEVVMVDIGNRRLHVTGKAAENIEKKGARARHKMIFLATLMAQYGLFEKTEDETGKPTIGGEPENNHFIFEAVAENPDLAEGQGIELLKEVYDHYSPIERKDPQAMAGIFSDFNYRGGFRNVLYPMGVSFSGTTEEMMPALMPFSELFMKSLGSYLAKVEERRGPPEEAITAVPAEGAVSPIITEPFSAMILGRGYPMEYEQEAVHMRGIAPDERIIRNYLELLRLRNPDGTMVVPPVRKVYLPMTTMWKRGPNIERKSEEELPAGTISLLRRGAEEGLFELVELNDLGDYDRAASELGADRDEFRTLLYTSLIPFMSDWIGNNAQKRLLDLQDSGEKARLAELGRAVGRTLKTLHTHGMIAGDMHLGQFVVTEDAQRAFRVDLVNVRSFDDMEYGIIPDTVAAEYILLLHNLSLSQEAAHGFTEVYSRQDMEAVGENARSGKAQINAAKDAVEDFFAGVVDWIVTPANERMMMSAKPSVDSSAARLFRRKYGSETITDGYAYRADMTDRALKANLREVFEKFLENMTRPEYSDKMPRAIIYAPAERYSLVEDLLDETLRDMELEGLAERVVVVRVGGIPDDGAVDEVMHVVLGKALLNYERFKQTDLFTPEAEKRLVALIKALVTDPSAIDLDKDPDILDKILDGLVELRIRPVDYEQIRDWKAAQDEILRSL
ncbi:MAG: protein kinase [Candidatus Omnitrophica bacterium]|nr:protein kinase [Candidatus Omnitrophota bacterium]